MKTSAPAATPWQRRLFLGVFVGVLLLQSGWWFVIPPFRGIDEHDHAYKAAAVALGDWSPTHPTSSQGWGDFVLVPADLVSAARPECEQLQYTTSDNCDPPRDRDDGLVEVASSAASYNPVFYFFIGTPSRAFAGTDSLYAMRIMASILCALMIAASAVVIRRWAQTPLPLAALLIALTPVMVYSTTIGAPNGLEMASALLVWSALLGVARTRTPATRDRFFAIGAAASIPLVTLRTLGPLWALLILVTILLLMSGAEVRGLLRSKTARVGTCVVVLFGVVGVLWTLAAGTNTPPDNGGSAPSMAWSVLPKQWILWFLQSIAAFPLRNEVAPLSVYAIALASWGVIAGVAWRIANGRERRSLVAIVALGTLIPVVMTVATYSSLGTSWQGRYGYPFTIGFILLCGFLFDAKTRSPGRLTSLVALGSAAAVMASTQTIGQLGVLAMELRTSPQSGDPSWIVVPAPVVALLTCAGAAALAWTMWTYRPPQLDARSDPLDSPVSESESRV